MFFIVKNGIFNLLGVLRILQNFWPDERVMYSVCALLLGPNFGVRLMADKKFYLRLTVEKMHALVVFTEKYLRSKCFSSSKDTATVNCRNPKTEIQIEIIETQIIGKQIYFVIITKKYFSFLLANLLVRSYLTY